jgi:hypothetical protein
MTLPPPSATAESAPPTRTPTRAATATRAPTKTPAPTRTPVPPTPEPECERVPDVTNMTQQEAQDTLKAAGYQYTWDKGAYEDGRAGLVVKQEPAAGRCGDPASTVVVFHVNVPGNSSSPSGDSCDVIQALYDAKNREDVDAEMAIPRAEPLSAEEEREQREYLEWYYDEYDFEYSGVTCLEHTPDSKDRNTEYVLVQYTYDFRKPSQISSPPQLLYVLMKMVFEDGEWLLGGMAPVFKGSPPAPYNLSPPDGTSALCTDFADQKSARFSWSGAVLPADQARFDYAADLPLRDVDYLLLSMIEIWGKNLDESEFSLIKRSDFFTFSLDNPTVTYDLPVDAVPIDSPQMTIKWRVIFVNNLFDEPRTESDWHTINLLCGPKES